MAIGPRHDSPEEGKARILQAARVRYLRGQRIELTTLATELGIGRATAYRWLGGNERLLAIVLTERISHNFARLLHDNREKTGREKVLGVVEGYLRHSAASTRLEALLHRDQRRALHVLAASAHGVPQLVIRLFEDLLTTEQCVDHLELPVPAHTLAYGIVSLIEAYLYADVFAGEKRDIDTAVHLIGLLVPPY